MLALVRSQRDLLNHVGLGLGQNADFALWLFEVWHLQVTRLSQIVPFILFCFCLRDGLLEAEQVVVVRLQIINLSIWRHVFIWVVGLGCRIVLNWILSIAWLGWLLLTLPWLVFLLLDRIQLTGCLHNELQGLVVLNLGNFFNRLLSHRWHVLNWLRKHWVSTFYISVQRDHVESGSTEWTAVLGPEQLPIFVIVIVLRRNHLLNGFFLVDQPLNVCPAILVGIVWLIVLEDVTYHSLTFLWLSHYHDRAP